MNEIRLVRLTSGEELLCKKTNESGLTITVTDAVALVPTEERLGFMPYLPYAEIEQLVIKKEHIMFDLIPTKELADKHILMHNNTNIVTPEKPEIIV
jgi:hypothetical protein